MDYQIFSHNSLNDSDKLVFIDLDNTILDHEKFKYDIWLKAFESEGFDSKLVEIMYTDSKTAEGIYDFKLHIRNISRLSNVEEMAQRILAKSNDLTRFLYDDVNAYLKDVFEGCNTVLLSFGDLNYQRHKFNATNLEKYFHASVFTQIRKPEFFRQVLTKDEDGFSLSIFPDKKFRQVTFIDDHPSELEGLPEFENFFRYRIRRPGAKYGSLQTPLKVIEIGNLNVLLDSDNGL